ncbi:1-phosphatidylinositol-3-phosphate 5-kinase [Phlyctochytrium bullatum]|nr:1-phosphatidylinositol-3-phosphate 5-kinase [Phlyctochytrium bullatum]
MDSSEYASDEDEVSSKTHLSSATDATEARVPSERGAAALSDSKDSPLRKHQMRGVGSHRRRNLKVGHPRPSKYTARAINRQMSIKAVAGALEELTGANSDTPTQEIGADGVAVDGAGGDKSELQPSLDVEKQEPGEFTYPFAPNTLAFQHLRRILLQLLHEFDVAYSETWESVIMGLVTRAASTVDLDLGKGDHMSVLDYTKIKRIPGGQPTDSQFVSGVVCSKNVAHKRMLRPLANPRILLLTFPIEYQRVENVFMSLDPVLSQEREYMKNLMSRILALKPTVVIVERTVARIALELLLEANIVVIHNMKPSTIEAIARCTQADVVPSMEHLSTYPRLGTCDLFQVRFYDNKLIAGGRKAFLYFEGCAKPLGCTIVLRGGNVGLLSRVKQIVQLLVFAAYNLRLESSLLRDEKGDVGCKELQCTFGSWNQIGHPVLRAIKIFENTLLSSSALVEFPVPYLLRRWQEHILVNEKIRMKEIGAMDTEVKEAGEDLAVTKSTNAMPSDVTIADTKFGISELLDVAENLSLVHHQNLMFLFSSICTDTLMPCEAPENHVIEYYKGSDMSLGQFLENLCYSSSFICQAKNCNLPMIRHFRSYAHGQGRVNVLIEEYDSPNDAILMWSYCKICKVQTPSVVMTPDTWKYSFGKYLEIIFYHKETVSSTVCCPHDIHRQHLRFFALKNFAVRFEYETIDLLEISVPPMRFRPNEELQTRWKNHECERIRAIVTKFYDSIIDRVKIFTSTEVVSSQKNIQLREQTAEVAKRASAEKKFLLQSLQHSMVVSPVSDVVSLNNVLKTLYEKAPEWDTTLKALQEKFSIWDVEFSNLLRNYIPIETTDILAEGTNFGLESTASHRLPQARELLNMAEPDFTSGEMIVTEPMDALRLKDAVNDLDSIDLWATSNGLDEVPTELIAASAPLAASSLLYPESPAKPNSFVNDAVDNKRDSPNTDAVVPNFQELKSSTVIVKEDASSSPKDTIKLSFGSAGELVKSPASSSPQRLPTTALAPSLRPLERKFSNPSSLISLGQALIQGESGGRKEEEAAVPAPWPLPHQRILWDEDEKARFIGWNDVTGVSLSEAEPGIFEELFSGASTGNFAGERNSIIKTLSSLWSGSAINLPPLEYPFLPTEHFFADSPIIVREDEPSSIIALMLSSPQYKERLTTLQSQYNGERDSLILETSTVDFDETNADIEETLLRPGNHLKFQFVHGQTKIECYKNPITGKSFRMDILVMENLFYDRRISRIFDLKGSMRNRHIQSTGKENEVLLDENLVECMFHCPPDICESPLFIREHSKKLLRASVYNDTLFLSKLNVMDYSLLVGIDEEKRVLVVGIVDFIRTFTWDKKLESWVKENAFLVMVLVGILRHHATQLLNSPPKQKLNAVREMSALMRSRFFRGDGTTELPAHGFTSRRSYLSTAFEKNQYLKNPETAGQPANPLTDPGGMEMMMSGMKQNMVMLVPQTLIMSWITIYTILLGEENAADGMRDMQAMQQMQTAGMGGAAPPDASALFKSEKEFLDLATYSFKLQGVEDRVLQSYGVIPPPTTTDKKTN